MYLHRLRASWAAITIVSLGIIVASTTRAQSGETILYRFGAVAGDSGGLVFDSDGALYGTTEYGGGSGSGCAFAGCGAVFKLAPPVSGAGQWTKTVIYRFKGGSDGARPLLGLIFDTRGALYGATYEGGVSGYGTVFKLTPPALATGAWNKSLLYQFNGGADGRGPISRLVFDTFGALYGETSSGGGSGCGGIGCGTVFKLSPPASGSGPWEESILHSFTGGSDGNLPAGSTYDAMIFDTHGALYGLTPVGGRDNCPGGCGTVFKLTPPASRTGPWAKTVLYFFAGGSDGYLPFAGLKIDTLGALFGATAGGGSSSRGTVFKLTPPASGVGQWSKAVLSDMGMFGLVFDTYGALYGTSSESPHGTISELSRPASGTGPWTRSVLYSFKGGSDGRVPLPGLIFDSYGALYGTTRSGGSSGCGGFGCGTVFKFQLQPSPPADLCHTIVCP